MPALELLDVRPGWGGGRLRATAIELEPLGREESEQLVEALAADGPSTPTPSRRCWKRPREPLFVEETVRMLAECEGRPLSEFAERIPDTLQALIAARIDRLPPEEKTVLQRASVIGRTFWGGAIKELATEVEELDSVLDTLLLREFLVPEVRSSISGETAYRFKHVLIREVAYSGLSKSARADLHERFAHWLRERAGEELLEIRAYHLDQAAALISELDGGPPPELAHEAAEALETAGRRSLAREAHRSARKQLLRALELEPTLERRYQAARAAWRLGDLPAVSMEMERVRAEAAEEGDRWCEARALAALSEVALNRDADVDEASRLAALAVDVADANDYEPRFDALHVLNTGAWWRGRLTDSERYARDQLALAQEAGRGDLESRAAIDLAGVHNARKEYELAAPLYARARVGRAERLDRRAGTCPRGFGRLCDLPRGLRRGSAAARGGTRPVRGGRSRIGPWPRPLPPRGRSLAPGRPRPRRTPEPRLDQDARAARGPRHPLRGAASARRGSAREGQSGRGRALRRGGSRHGRPPGHDLEGFNTLQSRPRAERPGALRRRREAATRGGGHHRRDRVLRVRLGTRCRPWLSCCVTAAARTSAEIFERRLEGTRVASSAARIA